MPSNRKKTIKTRPQGFFRTRNTREFREMRSFTAIFPAITPPFARFGSLLGIVQRNQFFPDVLVRLPVRLLMARDLHLFDLQSAVAERADILGARPAQQNMGPVSCQDRHPQAAQTG